MRIGLLVLSVGNFGKKGFYNLQEVGLARELDADFDEVLIYRLTDSGETGLTERIEGCKNAVMRLLPSKHIGSNGIPDFSLIDSTVDALVCFSDTQLFFPRVYRWCEKNKIMLLPYIGVSKSHSDNPIKQLLINLLFYRNLRLYKKLPCLAKTPDVTESLLNDGVADVRVAPVGLDTANMRGSISGASTDQLRLKYGLAQEDRIILFIGRMTAEKQPGHMVELFSTVLSKDASCRLLMVGKGELSEQVKQLIDAKGLKDNVTLLESVPNKDIWELYTIADCLVNLNRQEIYGMVLLEAMYYGCKVIAWHAPGPDYIIENGKTGYLTDSDDEAAELILHSAPVGTEAHQSIEKDFTWSRTAEIIKKLAEGKAPTRSSASPD